MVQPGDVEEEALIAPRRVVGERVEAEIEAKRRGGAAVVVRSNDPAMLRIVADEVWWFVEGSVRLKGHPDEVLNAYAREVVGTLRDFPAIPCALRRGDGRARLVGIETLNAAGRAVSAWQASSMMASPCSRSSFGATSEG